MTVELTSLPWFFSMQPAEAGGSLALDEEESRHARSSRRLAAGDEVGVFDGQGRVVRGVIEAAGKRGPVVVGVREAHETPRPRLRVTLAAALPKGDRAEVMLGMAAQLGAAAIVPLHCQRSVVTAGAGFKSRAKRAMIESCKQCHRAWLPAVHDETPLDELAAASRGDDLWMAHPGGEPLSRRWPAGFAPAHGAIVLIGPEGGFTDDEASLVRRRGGHLIGLGEGLLRVETAAVAVLSWMMLASLQPE